MDDFVDALNLLYGLFRFDPALSPFAIITSYPESVRGRLLFTYYGF